jgi:hypothetical protein
MILNKLKFLSNYLSLTLKQVACNREDQYKLNPKNWLMIRPRPREIATREEAHVSFSVILGIRSFNASLHDPINTV